ncbi:MAG: KH domain-containing protein [Fimbriimonadaceae bacterium]
MSYLPLVETIITGLVDNPGSVEIREELDGHTRTFIVKVAAEDTGKVIGKSGRVVSAIRQVVSAVASKSRERAFIKIDTDD